MDHQTWLSAQAALTLKRLQPRLEPLLVHCPERATFERRLEQHFPRLFRLLFDLYHDRYDFFYHAEQIILTAAQAFVERADALKQLDAAREADMLWFQSERMMGAVCYVDLFAGDLNGVRAKISYFKELGLTYLHLMPLFKVPQDENDGGYAISDYRQVDPPLGTMDDLRLLADELRAAGISLVLDFVFNHTAHDHTWARAALAGDEQYQNYYYMFDDRRLPDLYEQTLREIFPLRAPGNFTYVEALGKWVWTSFFTFQWDLNYKNPEVFTAMLGEMLFLANQGVEILRLDAVAFIWKEMGTSSENRPQAHWIIQAFNALAQVVAPGLLFKSEAIVHPADVASYIGWEEAPLSYNPTMMALLWEALATREVRLLLKSMQHWFELPERTAWVNYVRVHDDIGWTFADEDAVALGINGYDHRQFLNRFYTGEFDGSFAMGLPFGFNPTNQDQRISGTMASLVGLEQGLEREDALLIDHAVRRALLIHSIALSAGGIPLLYFGDEIAMLNDYSYAQHPDHHDDTRWAHRPHFDWSRAEQRHDESTVVGRVFQGLVKLITIRQRTPAFVDAETVWFDSGNPHVLSYTRNNQVLVLANFSEHEQTVHRGVLYEFAPLLDTVGDLLTGEGITPGTVITLAPYEFKWLRYNRE